MHYRLQRRLCNQWDGNMQQVSQITSNHNYKHERATVPKIKAHNIKGMALVDDNIGFEKYINNLSSFLTSIRGF